MLNLPGLYLVTSPSGRGYVGITARSFRERQAEHMRHSTVRTLIGKAFNKYGSRMILTPLVVCEDRETLETMEQRAIEVFDTMAPKGYNLSSGGNSPYRAIMECEHCGSEFDGKPGTSRFCSGNCKSAARRESGVDLITKNCANCGAPFVSHRYWNVGHCSRTCARVGMKYRRSF